MNEEKYQMIANLQKEVRKLQKEMLAIRETLAPEEVSNYTFETKNGEKSLADFFGENYELLVIHNMGKACSYCSLWADGINGFTKQLLSRVPFVVVSPDDLATQKAIAEKRNWQFDMASDSKKDFTTAMGFYTEKSGYYPGFSTFKKQDGKIYRINYDYFGPGDVYASIWHIFDLLPLKTNQWQPIKSA